MKKLISALVAVAAFSAGCERIPLPVQHGSNASSNSTDTIRRIVIENICGHLCINCPEADHTLDSLEALYPGQVIGVSIHAGYFAETCPPHPLPPGAPAGSFADDFNMPAENAAYHSIFGINGWPIPAGMVNRYGYGSLLPMQLRDWAPAAASIVSQPVTAYLHITPNYNTSTRDLTLHIGGSMLCDTTGTYNVAVYLLEDSIHGDQENPAVAGGVDTNYVFNRVFRGCINSPGTINGATVLTGTIVNGTTISYSMPGSFHVNAAFDDNHCRIVAFLYKTSDYGILQAAQCPLH